MKISFYDFLLQNKSRHQRILLSRQLVFTIIRYLYVNSKHSNKNAFNLHITYIHSCNVKGWVNYSINVTADRLQFYWHSRILSSEAEILISSLINLDELDSIRYLGYSNNIDCKNAYKIQISSCVIICSSVYAIQFVNAKQCRTVRHYHFIE